MQKFYDKPFFTMVLIFFLVPSPSVEIGTMLRMILLSVYSIGYILYDSLNNKKKNQWIFEIKYKISNVIKTYKIEVILLVLYFLYEFVLLFFQIVSKSTLSYTIRPLFYLLLLFFSFTWFKEGNAESNNKEILMAAYTVLIIQYLVSILQLFDINLFSFLYDDIKSYPLGYLVRVTGTLGNPNTLSWYISLFTILIILLEINKFKKIIFVSVGLIFTFLTGSRTMIVLTPTMWLFTYILYLAIVNKKITILFYSLLAVPILVILLFLVLKILSPILPYASQLLNVISGGLTSVNSFNSRLIRWEEVSGLINEVRFGWFFGARLNTFPSTDNDLLYGVFRSGIIGVFLQYSLYFLIMIKTLINSKENSINLFIFIMVLFSIIIGFQADTLNGWYYPIFIFLFYGSLTHKIDYLINMNILKKGRE